MSACENGVGGLGAEPPINNTHSNFVTAISVQYFVTHSTNTTNNNTFFAGEGRSPEPTNGVGGLAPINNTHSYFVTAIS